MSELSSILFSIQQYIWLAIYIDICVRKKYKRMQTYTLCIIASMVMVGVELLITTINMSYLVVVVLKFCIMNLLILESSKRKDERSLFVANSIIVMVMSGRMGYILISHIGLPLLIAHVVAAAINLAIYFVVCPEIKRLNKLDIAIDNRKWYYLCIIPLTLLVLMHSLWGSLTEYRFVYVSIVSVVILFVVSYNTISNYIDEGMKATSYKTENLLMNQLHNHIEKQLRIEQNNEQRIKELRHDMRHYDRMIKESILQHNYHQAIQLIDSKDEVYDSTKKTYYCDNPLINTLFNSFTNQYTGRLEFDIKAYIPKKMNVDQVSLSTVISNLVENAAEATLKNPTGEKRISIMVNYDNNRLIIEIKNPLVIDVVYKNGLPVSQKGAGHGLGMTSVQRFAKQYKGTFDISEEDGNFVVRILIKA